jgi:hypothetical protein
VSYGSRMESRSDDSPLDFRERDPLVNLVVLRWFELTGNSVSYEYARHELERIRDLLGEDSEKALSTASPGVQAKPVQHPPLGSSIEHLHVPSPSRRTRYPARMSGSSNARCSISDLRDSGAGHSGLRSMGVSGSAMHGSSASAMAAPGTAGMSHELRHKEFWDQTASDREPNAWE